jgi:hypothetical protein
MNAIIGFTFLILMGLIGILWLPAVAISYELTEDKLKIRTYGIRRCNIPYKEIKYCEVIKAAELWRPSIFLKGRLWHTHLFVDGIIIHSEWGNYVLTPRNPLEFYNLITQHQQQQNATQHDESQ